MTAGFLVVHCGVCGGFCSRCCGCLCTDRGCLFAVLCLGLARAVGVLPSVELIVLFILGGIFRLRCVGRVFGVELFCFSFSYFTLVLVLVFWVCMMFLLGVVFGSRGITRLFCICSCIGAGVDSFREFFVASVFCLFLVILFVVFHILVNVVLVVSIRFFSLTIPSLIFCFIFNIHCCIIDVGS